jgi:intein/homing endonuclease
MNEINRFLNQQIGTKDCDYVVASDTDSVVGDSLIYVNGKKISIQDYFESCGGEYVKHDTFNEDYVKVIDNNDVSYSVSKEGFLEEKRIKYIMKHKVKKRMYRITDSKGNSVVVTQDHSIIVRNKKTNKISDIKPSQLNTKIHEIINIHDGAGDTDRKATNETKQGA